MQAVVLVGGEGTRLRPLTYSRPKALVPFLGRPFLQEFIAHLADHGYDDVILAVSHGREAISNVFGDGADLGVRIRYADEPTPLGSGGAVLNVAGMLQNETFLVANGDILSEFDLTAMLALHRETHAMVSIGLTPVDDTSGFGVVEIDHEERIHRFVEKPLPEEAPSNWVNAGLWLFEPDALDFIPEGYSMVERQLFPELLERGKRVTGYRSEAYWMDLGTPHRYMLAHRHWVQERVTEAVEATIESGTEVIGPVMFGRHAIVRRGGRLVGPSYIGEASDIADGAEVVESVLWERVRVEHGATVRDSIFAEDVVIGAGACVDGAVLGPGSVIASGAHTPHGLRLDPGETYPSETD